MRKLLIVLALLVIAFVVADRVAQNVAQARIEERLASSIQGAEDVQVEFGGGLFLPQVFRGDLEEVTVSAGSLQRRGVRIDELELTLRRVSFTVGGLLGGTGDVRVQGGSGRATVSEEAVEAAVRREGVDAQVRLNGQVTITMQGVSGTVEELEIDPEAGALVLRAPPLETLLLRLPETIGSVGYSGATVEGNELILNLRVRRGTIEI
jgi:hypothetical protein